MSDILFYENLSYNPAEIYAIYYYRKINRPLNNEEIELFNYYIDYCNEEVNYADI